MLFIGIHDGIDKMNQLSNSLIILIISLMLGTILGEVLDISIKIERFGEYLKSKTNNHSDVSFINGFVNATCVVSIGAMAVIDSFNDGIYSNPTVLIMKAILDFIIIAMMSVTFGIGCMFSLFQ